MISYNIYITPKDDYITCTISNDKILISVDGYSFRAMIIDMTEVKDTRYIDISPERFNKLVQKAARKILCTVQ